MFFSIFMTKLGTVFILVQFLSTKHSLLHLLYARCGSLYDINLMSLCTRCAQGWRQEFPDTGANVPNRGTKPCARGHALLGKFQ